MGRLGSRNYKGHLLQCWVQLALLCFWKSLLAPVHPGGGHPWHSGGAGVAFSLSWSGHRGRSGLKEAGPTWLQRLETGPRMHLPEQQSKATGAGCLHWASAGSQSLPPLQTRKGDCSRLV